MGRAKFRMTHKTIDELRARETSRRNAWRLANPEQAKAYNRAYYLKNKEKLNARSRAWAIANPEKARALVRKSCLKNPKAIRAAKRAWKTANPEKLKAIEAMSSARKRAEKQSLNFIKTLMWVDDLSKLKLKKQ